MLLPFHIKYWMSRIQKVYLVDICECERKAAFDLARFPQEFRIAGHCYCYFFLFLVLRSQFFYILSRRFNHYKQNIVTPSFGSTRSYSQFGAYSSFFAAETKRVNTFCVQELRRSSRKNWEENKNWNRFFFCWKSLLRFMRQIERN